MNLAPENFSYLSRKVIENVEGTHSEPILVAIVPGEKGKGAVFVIKIEDRYFTMFKKYAGAKHLTLRCTKWRAPTMCGYSIRIVNKGYLIV